MILNTACSQRPLSHSQLALPRSRTNAFVVRSQHQNPNRSTTSWLARSTNWPRVALVVPHLLRAVVVILQPLAGRLPCGPQSEVHAPSHTLRPRPLRNLVAVQKATSSSPAAKPSYRSGSRQFSRGQADALLRSDACAKRLARVRFTQATRHNFSVFNTADLRVNVGR